MIAHLFILSRDTVDLIMINSSQYIIYPPELDLQTEWCTRICIISIASADTTEKTQKSL